MLRRRWEIRNPVLSFQTLTFDFTVLPYVVFSLNFNRMLPILLQGLGYGLDDRVIDIPITVKAETFPFSTLARPTPEYIQLPIQWVPRTSLPGSKAARP